MKFFVVFTISIFSSLALAQTPDEVLKPFGLKTDPSANFQTLSQSQMGSGNRKIQNLKLKSEAGEVDLTLTGPLEKGPFENYLKMETVAFKHLYQAALTPYPGKISEKSSCPKEFLPQISKHKIFGQTTDVNFTKATSRKTFGVCAKDGVAHEAATAILQLPNGYAVKAAAFTAPGTKQDQLIKLLAGFAVL